MGGCDAIVCLQGTTPVLLPPPAHLRRTAIGRCRANTSFVQMAYFRGAQSPRDEQQYTNPLSPPSQRNPNRWSANMATSDDVRGALTRRFTTNTVPTLSPIGQQRRQAMGDMQVVSHEELPSMYCTDRAEQKYKSREHKAHAMWSAQRGLEYAMARTVAPTTPQQLPSIECPSDVRWVAEPRAEA